MDTTTSQTLIAVFRDREAADSAVEDLRSNGFSATETLSRDTSYTGENTETTHQEGGIVGWFKRLFGEDEHPDRNAYERAFNSGDYLVTAYVQDDQVDRASDILNQHSPINIERDADTEHYRATTYADQPGTYASTTQTSNVGFTETDTRTAAQASSRTGEWVEGQATAQSGDRTIPVVQEELKVGKRAIERGGVRVYSRVVEQPVEEEVRLREERVRVDRTPVDRPTQAGDLQAGREQVYEVKEYAEEPVVSKEARVVEEVRVGKDASERVEKVRDTVRRTEVNVENLSGEAQTRAGAKTRSKATATASYGGNDDYYRQNFATQPDYAGLDYQDYAPAYQYGETMRADARYTGRSFEDVEPQLRDEYAQRYPNSTWDKMKNAVRTGWNRVSAKVQKA